MVGNCLTSATLLCIILYLYSMRYIEAVNLCVVPVVQRLWLVNQQGVVAVVGAVAVGNAGGVEGWGRLSAEQFSA